MDGVNVGYALLVLFLGEILLGALLILGINVIVGMARDDIKDKKRLKLIEDTLEDYGNTQIVLKESRRAFERMRDALTE